MIAEASVGAVGLGVTLVIFLFFIAYAWYVSRG